MAHAGDGIHQDREKCADDNQENRRRVAQAKPQDRKRDKGDRRNWPKHLDQRIEQLVDAVVRAHHKTQRQRQNSAYKKPHHHAVEAGVGVTDQFAGKKPGQIA